MTPFKNKLLSYLPVPRKHSESPIFDPGLMGTKLIVRSVLSHWDLSWKESTTFH